MAGKPSPLSGHRPDLAVNELILAFWQHVEAHYSETRNPQQHAKRKITRFMR